MAIQWGPYEYNDGNGMRVGIEVTVSSVSTSTPSITFTHKVYTQNQYRYSDPQSLNFGGYYDGSSSYAFTNNVGATSSDGGGVQLRVTKTYVYTYSSGSYGYSPGSRSFSATISGAYNGVTPSKTVTTSIPARPYAAPNAPDNVAVAYNGSFANAIVTWDRNATTQRPYTSQTLAYRYLSDTGVWSAYIYKTLSGSATSYAAASLGEGVLYEFAVRANNSEGSSSYAGYVNIANKPYAPAAVVPTVAGDSTYITVDITAPSMWDTSTRKLFIERSVNGGAWSLVSGTLEDETVSWVDSSPGVGENQYRARYYLTSTYAPPSGVYSDYVTSDVVTTVVPPSTPTAITPAASSTVTKPNPQLGGTIAAPASGQSVKMEWQIASNAGFTTGLVTITEPSGDLNSGGAHTEQPILELLNIPNGTWYVRGRAVDEYNNKSGWSSGNSFTVNTPVLPTPTTVTPAASSTVTTMTPTLGLTIVSDGAGRQQRGEWQLATDVGFTEVARTITEPVSDYRTSGVTTEAVQSAFKITSDLGTTWYVRARTLGNDGSVSAWSAVNSFTLAMAYPPAPTNLTPADGATITTSEPVLGATILPASEGRKSVAHWRLATDSGFTANVKTIIEASADLRISGSTTESISLSNHLFQTLWYVKVRAIDEYGQAGPWSDTQTFTISHKPTAAPSDPIAGKTIQWNNGSYVFAFDVSDAYVNDTLTAAQIIIERNDTGAVLLDTGKVNTSVKQLSVATTSPLIKDLLLRWKVRAWDSDDIAGNYSPYQLMALSDPPIITITSPAVDGDDVFSGAPTVVWSNDVSTIQVSRRVVFKRASTGVTIFDSGTVSTSSTTYTPPQTILSNLTDYTVTITVNDAAGMTNTATRSFTTDYQSPSEVLYTVDPSAYDTEGYIEIDWSTMQPDGFFVDWRVYRRRTDDYEWTLLETYTDTYTTSHKDYTATAGDSWVYAVTQTAGRSGVILESVVNETPTAYLADGTHYWLINPYIPERSMRVSNVTTDTYTDEYAEEELLIIGRGRKMNTGTRFGYNGTLGAQFRDDSSMTAREKRRLLLSLREDRSTMYLRNPFGDILEISMGNIGVDRVSGVGTAEFVDVTIPYKEVF